VIQLSVAEAGECGVYVSAAVCILGMYQIYFAIKESSVNRDLCQVHNIYNSVCVLRRNTSER
jgi:hypothetical protein